MRIEVDTKFNIGDMVYTVEPNVCWIPIPTPSRVTGVSVNYNLMDDNSIECIVCYTLSDELFEVNGDMCFTTFEECKQWCTEENAKEEWQ